MKQEIVGGSGISWTLCKSFAPYSREVTTPALHHSFLVCSLLLESVFHWLSKDTAKFEVDVGVCEKFAKL